MPTKKSELLIYSVVIPTYNRKVFVQIAIDSIVKNINASLFAINIIVVDDGSTDGTESYLEEYSTAGTITYLRIKNSERGFARNYGAKYAINSLNTDYLLFFDADDIMQPTAINTFHKKIIENCNIKCFFAQFQILTSENKLTDIRPNIHWPTHVRKYVIEKAALLPLGCTMLHASLFLETGGFVEDRDLSGSEDWLFLFQIINNNSAQFISEVTTLYRQHSENTNSKQYDQSLSVLFIILTTMKNQWKITSSELKCLKIQLKYNQVGVHNCTATGRPFFHLFQLIISFPEQFLQLRLYKYTLSVCWTAICRIRHYFNSKSNKST